MMNGVPRVRKAFACIQASVSTLARWPDLPDLRCSTDMIGFMRRMVSWS